MFESIGDMPLHPLIIHATVVAIPGAALLAVLFALPVTRRWARWPLLVVSLGAAAATYLSKESGEAFEHSLGIKPGNPVGNLIEQHSHLADQLFVIMLAFAVVAVLNVAVVRVRRPGASGGGRLVGAVLLLALLAVAVVAAVWVVRVGDLGARAVWNPTAA